MTGFLPYVEDHSVELFGVAVKALPERSTQRHVGVIYRDVEQRLKLLHLAAHDELVCGSCNGSYHCAEVGFDRYNRMMLAELAALIAENRAGQPIPYGFEYQGEAPAPLDRDGAWDSRASMTCATFVLGLFVTYGYPLIDVTTWPARESDHDWARSILANYLAHASGAGTA